MPLKFHDAFLKAANFTELRIPLTLIFASLLNMFFSCDWSFEDIDPCDVDHHCSLVICL